MSDQPFVIKRRKIVQGDGHHGGAWKVAYADFVTAMMAFFLLMWLLGATTEEQRKGLADYFDPSLPLAAVSGGGADMMSGDTVYATEDLAHSNHGGTEESTDQSLAASASLALSAQIEAGQVAVSLSPEGVVVDLMDQAGAALFALGGAEASALLREVVAAAAPVAADSGRPIKIVGHTDDLPFRTGAYTNWELSADRANAARRLLLGAGVPPQQVSEVSGRADRQPVGEDRSAPANRRISLVLQHTPKIAPSVNQDVRKKEYNLR